MLCGVASASGALIFSYVTANNADRAKVFKLVSIYRTSAGFFMAISQLVAIFGSYCDFTIGNFRVNSNNAPTFISSFVMALVVVALVFVLGNPAVPTEKASISFQRALREFFSAKKNKLLGSLIILWGMFLASFLMSEVVYFMPIFLTQSLGWETKHQGVAFMVASLIGVCGSLLFPSILKKITLRIGKKKEIDVEASSSDLHNSLKLEKREQEQLSKKQSVFKTQVILTIISIIFALIGQSFMIGAYKAFVKKTLPHINVGCFFVAGLSVVMLGYNGMASTFPSLFSDYIKPQVKVQLMPMIGAIAALGKLVAPIVLANLYQTQFGLSIAVGLGMIMTGLTAPAICWLLVHDASLE